MCANHQTDSLNCQSIDITGRYCHLDTAEARRGANDSPVSRIKSEWSKFRDLLPLLASSALPLGAKSILYSCVCVALCYMEKRFKRDLKKKIRG